MEMDIAIKWYSVCYCVCSDVEDRSLVMSKDQVSEKWDFSVNMPKQQSPVLSPEAAVVIVTDDDGDDDDDDDGAGDGDDAEDDEEKAATMQFATERIVKYFSRCIASTGEIVCSFISVEYRISRVLKNIETF